ncbi:MAG: TonB-dependent receptor plug domain-containing protein [Aestuariibacter sp.]
MKFIHGAMLGITCCFAVQAEQQDASQLLELSFDELLELEVTVASRNAQSLADAPSTVSVFTRTQLESFAINNVYDVLNYVPGFQVTRGDWVGAVPKEHARGVFLDNGYILFLVNGERLNELSFGKASVYQPYIPLNIVKRIEVIRGPGSALYGSNAFMGVVNIITRKTDNYLQGSIGEHGAIGSSLGLAHEGEGDWRLSLLFDYTNTDGADYLFQGQQTVDPHHHAWFNGLLEVDNFVFSLRWNESELEQFVNLGGVNDDNYHRSENIAFSARYQFEFGEASKVALNASHVEHEIESAGNVLDADNVDFISRDFLTGPFWITEDSELNLDVNHDYGDSHINWGVGYRKSEQTQAGTVTNYQNPQTGDIALLDEYFLGSPQSFATQGANARSPLLSDQETLSLYAQYAFDLTDKISAYIGARYDDVDPIDTNLSPRLAFNYQYNQQQRFKLQYGEAFRTPVTNELYSEDLVTVGNPDLKPERIDTLEFIWQQTAEQYRTEMVLFSNKLEGFVNKVPLQNSLTQFTFENDIDRRIQGIELDSNWRVNDDFELWGSFTQLFDEPINPSYKRFASVGGKWLINDVVMQVDAIWRDALTVEQQFEFGSYALWQAKLIYPLSSATSITLQSQNLFDKDYHVYEPRVAQNIMPGQRRTTWLKLDYLF